MQDHTAHVKSVIDELTRVKLILNPAKCHFAQRTIYLLGFCVSANGQTYLDPRKVTNTMEWPTPRTGKDIQRFLGLVNYFREYVHKISVLTASLDTLRNHVGNLGSLWTEKHDTAFHNLKQALLHAPILQPPNLELPFQVATDASDVGIGAVLYQQESVSTKPHYIGFMARSLTKSERNYGTTKRELLAIVFALQKFHTYLWGRHFLLHTDHKALVFIHTQKDLNAMLTNWFDTILNYNFTVIHLPGIDNILPDSLSRLFHSKKELGEGNSDKIYSSHYVARKGDKANRKATIAYLADSMLEPPTQKEKQDILEKAHLFGHFGAEAMVKAVHNNGMHWPRLMDEALAVAKKCPQCQKFNIVKTGYNPHRPVRSSLPGDHWAIDLAGPLPLTKRNNRYLLVMIDICSRFVILRPIPNKTAEAVVQALIPVFCDFGIPRIVQSDNGKEFANQVMERFKKSAGFDHRLITPYYPQANGAAERTVGTAMNTIKKVVEGVTGEWDLFVYSVQLAINNKVSKRLNTPPFNVMFGRRLNDFKNYNEETGATTPLTKEQADQRIKELQEVLFPAIEERTSNVVKNQKEKFDKTHSQRELPVNSLVRVKIHPNFRAKMDPVYEGPYTVVRKTQQGTYVLRDTTGETLASSYTISQLKPVVSDHTLDSENTKEVESILNHYVDEETSK
ncbi:Transposon Ty3-I Gag-Pol polyprotein, partial [Choanephora cucurbitarum]